MNKKEQNPTVIKPTLTAYKKFIKEIKQKKGTAAWLKEFIKWVDDYGNPGKKHSKSLITVENLTPLEFYCLTSIIKEFEHGGDYVFVNKGLADFLTKYGFNVKPKGIGYLVKEAK